MSDRITTPVLIIGGGATGVGLARDLALRGVKSLIVEQGDLAGGASGRNHGLLHSGARYVAHDPQAAAECVAESRLLKKLAPQCVEDTGGLVVAVAGDDENYVADFPGLAARAGVKAEPLTPDEALELEPALSPRTMAAFAVADGAVDPFRLITETLAQAVTLGAGLMDHSRVVGLDARHGRVGRVRVIDTLTGESTDILADQIVNASGAWSARVAALAGISFNAVYSKGTLIISSRRLCHRVINRMRPPSDGDILVPGGAVSVMGTTSSRVEDLDDFKPTVAEVDRMVEAGAEMVPAVGQARIIRAYAGIRPLIDLGGQGDDRDISRGFVVMDHADDSLANMVTVAGGKLTTYRLMAARAADLVCTRLGVAEPSTTHIEPLPRTAAGDWSELGGGNEWRPAQGPEDMFICECSRVPKSAVATLLESLDGRLKPGLESIGLRSRVGKGPCQGTFCSLRLAAHLHRHGLLAGRQGLEQIKAFLEERWRGQRPVLWGSQLGQAELQEAIHCGLLDLDAGEEDR